MKMLNDDELNLNDLTEAEIDAALDNVAKTEGELDPDLADALSSTVREIADAKKSATERQDIIDNSARDVWSDVIGLDSTRDGDDDFVEDYDPIDIYELLGKNNSSKTDTDNQKTTADKKDNIEPISIQKGDIVTLEPEIADIIEDYDPSDVYRVESVDGDFAKLSRNGKEVPELSNIPLEKLTATDSFVYDPSAGFGFFGGNNSLKIDTDVPKTDDDDQKTDNDVPKTDDDDQKTDDDNKDDVVVVEKGSKPIRWAKHFIEKVRKNTSVEAISKRLEASIAKDKVDSEELGNLNINGQVTSFKTSLLSKQLKFAKKSSDRWEKIKGWFKREKSEKAEQSDDLNNNISDNKDVNNNANNPIQNGDNKDNDIMTSTNPYEIFKELPEERKAAVLEDLINGLFFQKQILAEKEEIINAQEEKLAQAEEELQNSKDALEKATNTIENINQQIKGNGNITDAQNQNISNDQDQNIIDAQNQNIPDDQDQNIIGDQNQNISNDQDQNIIDAQNQNIPDDQDQNIIGDQNQNISNDQDQNLIDVQNQNIPDNQDQNLIVNQNQSVDDVQNKSINNNLNATFTEEERKADEERRRAEYDTYDRERQAEVEAFWQNQAAYVGSDEYVQLANERATEYLERQNKKKAESDALEQEKREALIKENNRKAALNRIKSNLILDAYNDEQIMALDQIGNEDENKQGFRR